MTEDHSLKSILKDLTLEDLQNKGQGEVLEIKGETNVYDAVKMLIEHRFCSAPVLKRGCNHTMNCSERYCGILAPHDIMRCFMECYKESHLSIVEEDSENDDLSPIKYIDEMERLKDYAVQDIVGQCEFEYLYNSTSLYDAIKAMSKSSSYRICVIDKDDPTKLVDFITKKKLETILYNTIISDPVLSQMTVKDLKLNRDQNLISLNEYQTTFDALSTLVRTGYSGLPIVNSTGQIVGKICVTDIYYLFSLPSLSFMLRSPIKKYLEIADIDIGCKNAANASICHDNDTLQMIMTAFLSNSWNRIFIVDSHQVPLCCVTLYDLLRMLL